MVRILQLKTDERLLRTPSKEVALSDINTPEIQDVIARMHEAIASQEDGVAISAIQIGEPYRIFIISGRAFDIIHDTENGTNRDLVCINPTITNLSKKKEWLDEGCLSVRGVYGEVERSEKATIEAYDIKGNKFTRGGSGLLAQIFQHEYDHLDGILFIDKARNLHEHSDE